MFKPLEKKSDPIQVPDLVLVLGGPFQGRWLRVNGIVGEFAYLTLKYNDDVDKERIKEVQSHGLLAEDAEIDFYVKTVIEGDWIKDKVERRKRKSVRVIGSVFTHGLTGIRWLVKDAPALPVQTVELGFGTGHPSPVDQPRDIR